MTINEKFINDMILQAKITKGESFVVNADFIREFLEEFNETKRERDRLQDENDDMARYVLGDEPFDKNKNIPEGELEYRIYWVLWYAFWKNEGELESMLRIGHKQNYCNKAAQMLTYGIKELGGKFNDADEVNEWLTYGEDTG